jgi:hypothetical protein
VVVLVVAGQRRHVQEVARAVVLGDCQRAAAIDRQAVPVDQRLAAELLVDADRAPRAPRRAWRSATAARRRVRAPHAGRWRRRCRPRQRPKPTR